MTERLRILYHHRTQGRGAEGNHIVSIVTALRGLGHEVDLLSPPGVDPFDPSASIPVDKARTQTRGWSSMWKLMSKHLPNWLFELTEVAYNVPAYFRLRRALRSGAYDLVFERYAFFLLAGALAARRSGCDFVLEVNEVSGIPQRARKQSFPRLCAAMERRLMKRCDLVHAVSSYLGDRVIATGVDKSRVVVVPNGFDVARLKVNRDREAMRRMLGVDGARVIGFAGWFDRWDRLDFLVDAFAALRKQHSDIRLCLVGAGPGADDLRSRVTELGLEKDIVLTGAVPRAEVYDYLQVFDVGILPHSNVFGSPIVMFEMMGLNIPLVLPRLPPILDVHAHADTALLFEPLDATGCRAALDELVKSEGLRRTLAARARRKLLAQHSWLHTAERIMAARTGASLRCSGSTRPA